MFSPFLPTIFIVAYLGTICNSENGFAVSASMKGSFESMDAAAVWDVVVVMHELGMFARLKLFSSLLLPWRSTAKVADLLSSH